MANLEEGWGGSYPAPFGAGDYLIIKFQNLQGSMPLDPLPWNPSDPHLYQSIHPCNNFAANCKNSSRNSYFSSTGTLREFGGFTNHVAVDRTQTVFCWHQPRLSIHMFYHTVFWLYLQSWQFCRGKKLKSITEYSTINVFFKSQTIFCKIILD